MDRAIAQRVIDFWLCIEYIDPPKLDDPDPKKKIWSARSDKEWPWQDRAKKALMGARAGHEWRTTILCGILDLAPLVSHELKLLLSDDEALELPARAGRAVTIVFTVDDKGRLCGPVSFSSLLWIMGVLTGAKRSGTGIRLGGFDGEDGGFEAKLKQRALEHLETATTIAEKPETPENGAGAGDGSAQAILSPPATPTGSTAEQDPRAKFRPVTFEDIRDLERFILGECGWTPNSPECMCADVQTKSFAVKSNGKGGADPSDILNTFLAPDLRMVRRAVADNNFGPALASYLSRENTAGRMDVQSTDGRLHVERATMPDRLPLGRWPSEHPLVLAQQFAVNAIVGRTPQSDASGRSPLADQEGGLFSVNGPPGTGKTTLLRDVVAAVVTSRADILATFERADAAFGPDRVLHDREPDYTYHSRVRSLSGFGIVVASSNNGAVENVSRELPTARAVDVSDRSGRKPDYFADVADGLLVADPKAVQRKPGAAWGMIAAVLGNKGNRERFAERFWEGITPDPKQPKPEFPFVTFPTALDAGMADGSILPWPQARTAYLEARRRCLDRLGTLDRQAEIVSRLLRLRTELSALEGKLVRVEQDAGTTETAVAGALAAWQETSARAVRLEDEARLVAQVADAEATRGRVRSAAPREDAKANASEPETLRAEVSRSERGRTVASQALEHEAMLRPGWLQRLLRPMRHGRWQADFAAKRARLDAANEEAEQAVARLAGALAAAEAVRLWKRRVDDAEALVAAAHARALAEFGTIRSPAQVAAEHGPAKAEALRDEEVLQSTRARSTACTSKLRRTTERVVALRNKEAAHVREATEAGVDMTCLERFAGSGQTEEQRQKGTPWYDQETWHLRHEVFLRALDLHKSFVAANKDAVEDNLKCLVHLLDGRLFHGFVGRGRLETLWDTLFLVVPVVSTTFASMGTQFRGMGQGTLGWLIIDEAGQATPQAAVGGIWRAKRTVVVGDPLQLEPICALPERAIELLQERFELDGHWHPVGSSTQVVADRCNTLGTTIGQQWVGSPLRVHRRCLDPMFRVANDIAYDGLMVHATNVGHEGEWLGESCWIDVPSIENGASHDIPSQRALTCDMVSGVLEREGFTTRSERTSVYVISPFKSAAEAVVADLKKLPALAAAARSRRESVDKLVKLMAGTVHTFQGKEAEVVVLLLGCSASRTGAIRSFAARAPNLLNVALTRARMRVYVVGDLGLWGNAPYFRELAAVLARDDAILSAAAFRQRAGLAPPRPSGSDAPRSLVT